MLAKYINYKHLKFYNLIKTSKRFVHGRLPAWERGWKLVWCYCWEAEGEGLKEEAAAGEKKGRNTVKNPRCEKIKKNKK